MQYKISDFILAVDYLRRLCKQNSVDFIDFNVCFDNNFVKFDNNTLYIGDTKSLGHTVYNIISNYIINFNQIYNITPEEIKDIYGYKGSFLDNLLIGLATLLRIKFFECGLNIKVDGVIKTNIYRKPFLWLFFKNILCPLFDVEYKNFTIIMGNSNCIDIAKFFTVNDAINITDEKIKEDFIFENLDIENKEIRFACIIIELMKACGLNPQDTIRTLMSGHARDTFTGLVKLQFKDQPRINYFIFVLHDMLGLPYEHNIKQAQNSSPNVSTTTAYPSLILWNLPLTEALLESVRGPDIEIHNELESQLRQFWDQVERIKKDKYAKGEGVPFDALLRLKSLGSETDSSKTLQSLLSSARVW